MERGRNGRKGEGRKEVIKENGQEESQEVIGGAGLGGGSKRKSGGKFREVMYRKRRKGKEK